MPFVVVAGVPHQRALGPAPLPCPTCRGPRTLERRWHTLWVMVLPLFTLRARVVAVCPRCKTEEAWAGPLPPDAPAIPMFHRVGWALPAVAVAALLASLIVPAQLRRHASAELAKTPGGKMLNDALSDARGGGCSGQPTALTPLACTLMRGVNDQLGGMGGSSVRVLRSGDGLLLVIQSTALQRAGTDAARAAAAQGRDLAAKALAPGAPLVVVAADFKDPRAFVAGKAGGAFAEEAGSRVDLAPAAALLAASP